MNDYNIKKMYEEMEQEIISSMKRNYKRHLNEESKTGFKYTQWQAEKLKELKRYQRENENIIGKYTNNLSKEVSKHLQEELKQGAINSIKQYNKILKQDLKPSKIMNKSFFKTNDRKVNSLIKVVNNDLKTANKAVLRMSNDQYRQVIHKSAFFVGNGVFTERQAASMATDELTELQLTKLAIDESNKDFLSRGLACIEYKDGRRVNIASYSQMAVRTANLRAQLMGEGDFRKSIGRHLVQATSHGGACPICQKWEKHIFIDDVYSGGTKEDGNYTLLSIAMKQGFLHPNCKHGLTTYYPETENIENETEEEYEADIDYINQQINYIERNIKRYERLATGSIASSNVKNYNQKEKKWIEEKNKISRNDYYDVTDIWINTATPNSNKIIDSKSYVYDGKRYIVDGKKVVLDYSDQEKNIAEWLEKTFGGSLRMNPRINYPEGIKTSDYIFRKEKWDLKTIKGNSNQVLYHSIHNKKTQSSNFIFDISDSKLSLEEAKVQTQKLYTRKDTSFLNRAIIKKNDKFIIYKRK